MIRPSGFTDNMPSFKPGDLVTFIEGDSWVFITKAGQEAKEPPVGIVISTFDEVGIRVYWSTGELTMEWKSQLQLYSLYKKRKEEDKKDDF